MIVYLHGFNSAYNPNNNKIVALSKLDTVHPLSYNSFDCYENVLNDIISQTKHLEDLVFVGTSLGGFYAAACASALGVPCVLINPVVCGSFIQNSAVTLIKDSSMVNYVTGAIDTLTQTVIDSYDGLDIKELHYECKPMLLLDLGDEMINSHDTFDHLENIVSDSSVCYTDGSHRFDHIDLALPAIQSYINNLCVTTHCD